MAFITKILPQIINVSKTVANTLVQKKSSGAPVDSGAAKDSNANKQDTSTSGEKSDLRIKISMPPNSPNIFYKDASNLIMLPLDKTKGFLFPVQPAISITHSAEYQTTKPTHSNFPYYHYTNSEIQQISLTGEFPIRTAHDAEYVHAGIHFLRSCTRMFNSRDGGILAGAPPLVVRLNGLGMAGFDNIPVVINSVIVNYSDSVDYITFKPFNLATEKAKMPVLVNIQVAMSPVFSRDFISNVYSTVGYSTGKVRLLGPVEPVVSKPTIQPLTNEQVTEMMDFIDQQGFVTVAQNELVSTSGPKSASN